MLDNTRKKFRASTRFNLLSVSVLIVIITFAMMPKSPETPSASIVNPAQSGWSSDTDPFPTAPPYTGPPTTKAPSDPPPPRPDNPSINVSCDYPEMTIAILMDRSSSVISETGNATPQIFKNSTKDLLDRLHDRFEPVGRLNVLLYAFGTKSVIQNDIAPDGTYITDASTKAAVNKMKSTIDQIHFVDTEDPNSQKNPHHLSGGVSPDALRKAYNYGSTHIEGNYGLTNWHDAFVQLRNDASTLKKTGKLGGKVDLAIMLTDGLPNVYNRKSNKWNVPEGSAFQLNKWSNEWATLSMIDVLRNGATTWDSDGSGNSYPINKISVRGLLIRPDIPGLTPEQNEAKNEQARGIARKIFGKDENNNNHFFFAKDFSGSLSEQITNLINVVSDDVNCNGGGDSGIDIEILPSADIKLLETEKVDVTFKVTNVGSTLLTEVKLCVGTFVLESKKCEGIVIPLTNLEEGAFVNKYKTYTMQLGSDVIEQTVTAYGHDGNTVIYDSEVLKITPERVALPS